MQGYPFGSAALLVLIFLLQGCATVDIIDHGSYVRAARLHLYQLSEWRFHGRLALRSRQDSWSASIDWRHAGDHDRMILSGPLGQGGVSIELTMQDISIDRGDGQIMRSVYPDRLIREQLGVFVPVRALRYWVIGLTEPGSDYRDIAGGFEQSGWQVRYLQFMRAAGQAMPRKMTVTSNETKLKLIIDQWQLYDRET